MQLPSSTRAISEFEAWALPPTSGLKETLIVKRYNDPNMNAAFHGFLQCYYWLESEFKKQQGTNTPDVLQNAKLNMETKHAPTEEQKGESWTRIHFVKLGELAKIDVERDADKNPQKTDLKNKLECLRVEIEGGTSIIDELVKSMGDWLDKKPEPNAPSASPLDTQVGGSHYTEMAIQPFEFSMRNNLDPCQHTAIKYIARFRQKDGIADLDKAIHTIQLLKHFESTK